MVMVVVVVAEAVVIAQKVFRASMHVKQLWFGRVEAVCIEKSSRTEGNINLYLRDTSFNP
jgi:hypothetical protein